MTRQQLEHLIRACAATADVRDVVVIGSQSILASFPDPPTELTVSTEADVYPKDALRAHLIDAGTLRSRVTMTPCMFAEARASALARLDAMIH